MFKFDFFCFEDEKILILIEIEHWNQTWLLI
jgi:hypothetical protein